MVQAHAKSSVPTSQEEWTCWAQGKQSFGSPGGDIWTTVIGTGEFEFEASNNAIQKCMSQGLQMCTVNNCFKN
ncbi:MAG: hypothetical protein ACXVB1_03980 [Pseudobdellovibrionaceae bacterium]